MNASATSDPAKDSPGDILIIDDTPDNLRFLSDLLTRAGYSVRKVITGELGIEAARLEPPDLILLDIMMPGTNGYKVCERLKMSDRTQHIPIVFLSALDEELDKVQAFQIGGIDYITKPFQVVEVLARIETHLKLSRLQHELQHRNRQLQHEIEYRTAAESALQILNQGLEARIQERTAELQQQNKQLLDFQLELQKALTQEQRLSELKSQLITTIAQDFRTPITMIQTAIGLLKPERLSASSDRRYVEMIADSAQQLHKLLRDTLLLSDVDANTLAFNPTCLDLNHLCQIFIQHYPLPAVPAYHISFVMWGKANGEVFIDKALFEQMLTHLVSNAVRYSPQGGTILFELVHAPTNVLIRIRDEGIGIPAEDLDRIFDRFYRASNADALPVSPGNGLGLAIVKQVVELHGGTIAVSSEVGKGSTFTVQIPYQA
ncbi:hybrid sensor histidine kinase/response regulator [Thermocoleostomius sinensis]|uniref:histidine kinase n=1 Tax=Thermocoleostomius sinensis A174 TaxID=2016057 RepID=A0A9E8ZB25_9CYAN|nr:hybrid sensor histidine kinase/response regulator [Thermocoleostomius sinensis]WAL58587.1 hybrid sensor histidine kinase/response regulator [Thermocoleostomius sinensis A174]